MTLVRFWLSHGAELATLLEQHVVLVLLSTGIAVCLGLPLGVLAAKRRRLGRTLLAFINIAQTVPSLALLGFLLPVPFIGGIGPRTALVALSLYALLPIMRATVTGLQNVDAAVVEAGVAVGMTARQLLLLVELPLALPSIISGIRVATVIGVGTATIAAAVGAGGLGEYIFRGLSMVDSTTILAGAIPAAVLALAADGCLAWLERRLRPARVTAIVAAPSAALAVLLVLALSAAVYARPGEAPVVVGSKNFTEQIILGELVAQAIEDEGEARVVRKLNLGGTFICDRGIRTGDLDVYVEYTGTAVAAVFHQEVPRDSKQAYARAQELYAQAGLSLLAPLGFNNTFTILVRGSAARDLRLRTIDDLRSVAEVWTPGFGYEFLQRDDGYRGLLQAYQLRFKADARAMDLSLIYRALAEGQVDITAGDATSALIDTLGLAALEDTRHYFPPYDAVPLVRTSALLRRPAIGRAMARLGGRLSDREMRALNAAVDLDHQDVKRVVRQFLDRLPRHDSGG
jgi:osmoprotectant transport system substrate-binding protein/osmoprotectant transport system permease protein